MKCSRFACAQASQRREVQAARMLFDEGGSSAHRTLHAIDAGDKRVWLAIMFGKLASRRRYGDALLFAEQAIETRQRAGFSLHARGAARFHSPWLPLSALFASIRRRNHRVGRCLPSRCHGSCQPCSSAGQRILPARGAADTTMPTQTRSAAHRRNASSHHAGDKMRR